ncbi:alpha/beta fold hydrolase [Ensifer sp. 4252]|uniref:alpha/beta fold hydrolase n=1 Tax=Ensifer sp. 4252 TaxID=3373915 RepID=UPI003D1CDBF4
MIIDRLRRWNRRHPTVLLAAVYRPSHLNVVAARPETLVLMPVLELSGVGGLGSMYDGHLRHVAENVRSLVVEGPGHWVPEEQPAAVAEALLEFLPPTH